MAVYDIPWHETVLEFLKVNKKAKDTGDKSDLFKFLQKRLAQNIGLTMDDAIEIDIKLDKNISISGYKVENEIARYLSVDTQGSHYWVNVYALDDKGHIWVKYFGKCDSDEEVAQIQKDFEIKGRVLVDTAYDQLTTRRICWKHKRSEERRVGKEC